MKKTKFVLLVILGLFLSACLGQAADEHLVYLKVACAVVSSFDDTPDWAPPPNSQAVVDSDLQTRWSSKLKLDNQWIYFDFGKEKYLSQIKILWERAFAVDYEILISKDAKDWQRLILKENQDGGLDEISFEPVKTRYIKIVGLERSNADWGISIWETEFYGPSKLNPDDKPIEEIFHGRKSLSEELKKVTPAPVLEESLPGLGAVTPEEFQKGIVYTSWGTGELGLPASDKTLEYLYNKGVRHIGMMVVWFQDAADSKLIWPDTVKDTPTDEALTHAINTCHRLGMKVMLKPHIDLKDGSWRGEITPSDEWFLSYQDFIVHYAQLASTYNVELFCIGTELANTTIGGYEEKWMRIIDKIKECYKGPLIYAANWNEYHYVPFWKRMDFIGIDAYFPLTGKNDPSVEELKNAWSSYADKIEAWRNKESLDIPVVFTEIGYSSADGTNKEPWQTFAGTNNAKIDEQEQSDCLQALMEALSKRGWFKGMYWWQYFPQERFNPLGFLIRCKPTEEILSDWYKNKLK
jgi:hypothetical protein